MAAKAANDEGEQRVHLPGEHGPEAWHVPLWSVAICFQGLAAPLHILPGAVLGRQIAEEHCLPVLVPDCKPEFTLRAAYSGW